MLNKIKYLSGQDWAVANRPVTIIRQCVYTYEPGSIAAQPSCIVRVVHNLARSGKGLTDPFCQHRVVRESAPALLEKRLNLHRLRIVRPDLSALHPPLFFEPG